MRTLKMYYQKLNKQTIKLSQKRFFNEIYVGFLMLLTLGGWCFSPVLGMIGLIICGLAVLLITQDLKYVIPNVAFFIFTFSDGFANDEFPISIFIFGGIFVAIIVIFAFKDGLRTHKMHSLVGLAGMAVFNILPIFWAPDIAAENRVFYCLYFGDLGYLLLYIVMVNGIKRDGLSLLCITMSYLALLLSAECAIKVYQLKDTTDNILSLWYYLGWGLCNEAGILICFTIPFIFYLIGIQKSSSGIIFQHFKLLFSLVGLLLTTSRGSYIFGLSETFLLYLILLFKAKSTRIYQDLFFLFCVIAFTLVVGFKKDVINFFEDIHKYVFFNQMDDSGRKRLWIEAFNNWDKNYLTRLLGPGIVCEVDVLNSSGGEQLVPVIFHSTLFETLACSGIVGVLFLGYHLWEKYRAIYYTNSLFFATVGVGMVIVDGYGMIDNTYHMYYFMLPLCLIMAVIDASTPDEKYTLNLAIKMPKNKEAIVRPC